MAYSLVLLALALSLAVFSTYSWFTARFEETFHANVGFVDVDLDLYFVDDYGTPTPAAEVEIVDGVYKPGVYAVNVVSDGAPDYFNRLRLDINVNSNVDTYFRVKIYEQLTLTYLNYDDSLTELSILIDGYLPFNYEMTNWYDNRIYDDYLYYMVPAQRVAEGVPLEIPLIAASAGEDFSPYSPGYSLQVGFSIEAVQADGGPENVWGLVDTPWGTSW